MSNNNDLVKGVLIGSLIGGIAGLLLAPKPGNKLVKDLVNTYENAQKNGQDFISAIKETGSSLAHPFEEDHNYQTVVIGGVISAVIAGIVALLLAPQSGKKLRQLLGDQYEEIVEKAGDFASTVSSKGEEVMENVNDWKDTLGNLISKLSHHTKGGAHHGHSGIDEILDLAHVGIRLYQQLQRR